MHNRVYYYDFLNIISCLAVIALHHNGIVHTFTPTSAWQEALFVEVACYWAVPVFFMLSGATLMEYRDRYNTRQFFLQRIKRTFIPFLFWSFFWAMLFYLQKGEIPNPIHLVYGILTTNYQGVYWFFIPLFILYLLMPVLSLLRNNYVEMKYLSVLIFISVGLMLPFFNIMNIPPIGGVNSIAGPIFFVLTGYLLSKGKLILNKYWLIALSLFCFVLRYWVTYHFSSVENGVYRGLFNYYYFISIIPAVTVFVLVRDYFPTSISDKTAKLLRQLSSYSLGVFLLHKLVMYAELKLLEMAGLDATWLGYRTLFILVTYLVCISIVASLLSH